MPNGKDKPPSYVTYRRLAIFVVLSLILALIDVMGTPIWLGDYQMGDVARSNIKAPADIHVPSRDVTLKNGEMLVREGERITDEHLWKLAAVRSLEVKERSTFKRFLLLFLILFPSIAVIYEYGDRNIKKFSLSEKDLIFCSILTIFTTLLVRFSLLLSDYFAPSFTTDLFYVIPIFLFGIIIRIVLFSEAAIMFSLVLAMTMAFAFTNSLQVFLYTFVGNLLASHLSGKCENRNTILKAGLYTSFIMAFLLIILTAFFEGSLSNVPLKLAFVLFGGVGSSFIALGLLPIIEHVFDYTTDVRLLELANLEHPLLEEMMVSAPGTYHHSIMVGNLSKAAAESIGAHPLLARVSAYYHDIGKLKMPHYYIENRTGFDDAHKSLSPSMSALIILSHTKEGQELAQGHRLGRKITEIITQHHGTSLVSYFYNRAKELEDPKLHVIEEKEFRYPGPRPQTKEAGIVMLADAVEASSRILDEPTPKRIETHVQDVIEAIFLDGQLDECELTLKDLHAIQKSFIAMLIGIFHQRIEYPERTGPDGTSKKLAKNGQGGYKDGAKDHRRLVSLFRSGR